MKNKSFLEITKKLGPLEEKILFLVERSKNPREILNQLNQGEKQYAYTTIMTVMDKLFKKGYLTRVKKEKTYFYQPVDNLAKLIEANHISIFDYLIKFFGRVNFLQKSLYLIFILPFLNLINHYSFYFNFVIVVLTLISGLNLFFNFYLNGFFEYITMIFFQPSILLQNFALNSQYLTESLSITNLIFLIFGLGLTINYFRKSKFKINKFIGY
jgi:predicted transcriptional regulator